MTKPSIFRYEGHNYLVPFLIISSLFFMWGFAHGILEVLNPHFQESFHISKAMSALTQAAVYGAYFLMALPAGWIIRKWGYRRGVITGLVLFGIGALMFIPGSRINSFYFFVLSLFVIGCGLTCLETSANPYTTVLGHPDKAESRINLSQSLNGIGWIVGPLVGGQLLFSGVNIAIPYVLVGIFVLAVALVLSRIKLPTIFSLALRDKGTKTKLASSLLIMTIVGGAVAPVIMGYIADTTGCMAIAFLIPMVCYWVIGGYALSNRHVPL